MSTTHPQVFRNNPATGAYFDLPFAEVAGMQRRFASARLPQYPPPFFAPACSVLVAIINSPGPSLHPSDRDEVLDRPELGIAGNQDCTVFHGGCQGETVRERHAE